MCVDGRAALGELLDQDLLAAAAIFDVRVVVVSAACETPLVYDLGNEDDEAPASLSLRSRVRDRAPISPPARATVARPCDGAPQRFGARK